MNVGSSVVNKMYEPGGDVIMGTLCICGGKGIYGKFLYLPLNFAVNLKLPGGKKKRKLKEICDT